MDFTSIGQAITGAFSALGNLFVTPLTRQVDLSSVLALTALVLLVAVPAVAFLQYHMRSAISEI